jgi:hypothetical protein
MGNVGQVRVGLWPGKWRLATCRELSSVPEAQSQADSQAHSTVHIHTESQPKCSTHPVSCQRSSVAVVAARALGHASRETGPPPSRVSLGQGPLRQVGASAPFPFRVCRAPGGRRSMKTWRPGAKAAFSLRDGTRNGWLGCRRSPSTLATRLSRRPVSTRLLTGHSQHRPTTRVAVSRLGREPDEVHEAKLGPGW